MSEPSDDDPEARDPATDPPTRPETPTIPHRAPGEHTAAHRRPPQPQRSIAVVRSVRLVVAVAGVILAVTALGWTASSLHPSGSSLSSTTTTAAPSPPTPLGCPEANAGDPWCTDRVLASRLWDINLGSSTPDVLGDQDLAQDLTWANGTAGLEVQGYITPRQVQWMCRNQPEGKAHTLTFTRDEWAALHTDGGAIPPQLAAALPTA